MSVKRVSKELELAEAGLHLCHCDQSEIKEQIAILQFSTSSIVTTSCSCHFQCYQRDHQNCMHSGNLSVTDECKEGIQGAGVS